MVQEIRIARGQCFEFPVPPSHPLAQYQRLRAPSRDELLQHPFYSAVIERQIQLAPANPSEEVRNSIIDGIIGLIGFGHEIVLDGQNIIVEEGAYMSIRGSWTWLTANEFVVRDGGVVRVNSADPSFPAFLLLRCNTFGY
jgi:hypothetical protein